MRSCDGQPTSSRRPPSSFRHSSTSITVRTAPRVGDDGIHRASATGSVVEICTNKVGLDTRVMVLHETAHAWADHSLTDERKAAFRRLRGWEHWRDYDAAEWHENGTEQAAEIIVWGLIDQPIQAARIHQNSCPELLAGY